MATAIDIGSIDYHGGTLDLRAYDPSIPNNTEITGSLLLGPGYSSKKLPANLTVRGNLIARGCASLTTIPGTAYVEDALDIRYSGVTSLSTGLNVGHVIGMGEQGVDTLPVNLTWRGWLNTIGTTIDTLPVNMTVGGIHINEHITAIPNNFEVMSYLRIPETVTSIGANLVVWSNLYKPTSLALPPTAKVGGSIVEY